MLKSKANKNFKNFVQNINNPGFYSPCTSNEKTLNVKK